MPDNPNPTPGLAVPPGGHPLIDRYRDGYRVAGAAVSFGTVIKAFGWVVGMLTLIAGVLAGANAYGPGKLVFAFGGFFSAALVVLSFYVTGTVVAAIGQILRASLDHAVHTSPFLSNEQKAEAMN